MAGDLKGERVAQEITFSEGERFEDFDGGYVQFTATRDGQQLKFRISREALDTLAAAPIPTGKFIEAFDDMKERIWEIARRKADAIGGGHSGVILIRWEDV